MLIEQETIDLNLVLLPDSSTNHKLILLSQQLGCQLSTKYTLGTEGYPPHLSLYSALYPKSNIDRIITNLTASLSDTKSFPITLGSFSNFSGYIFYNAVMTSEIRDLHDRVVDMLNPLREGLISEDQKGLVGLTQEQEKAIEEFGYVSVGANFMPHITLAHITDTQNAQSALEILPKGKIIFTPVQLALVSFDLNQKLEKPLYMLALK